MKRLLTICLLFLSSFLYAQQKPVRMGIVGQVHTHVHGILGRAKTPDIDIVGIVEPNRPLAEAYAKQYGFSMEIVFPTMEAMVAKAKPEAVLAFNSIYDHLKVVEFCAPLGIHVMVEKPLAVSYEHVKKMMALAKKHHILLLTNYETTWYGSNKMAWQKIYDDKEIGDIRKIVFHTGHQGPIEIGCPPEFLEWLTDPVKNGGGALTDFGCYGSNIATWLMKGETPLTVTAITQQMKPDKYPKVDDEATIVVTYPKTQVIIQASWNWPFGRKDMEVYGSTGYVFALDKTNMKELKTGAKDAVNFAAPALPAGKQDPFEYFAGIIRGNYTLQPFELSSPENNEIVVKILEAARVSSKTGKSVNWKEFYGE